jgi:HEAT repeat protein
LPNSLQTASGTALRPWFRGFTSWALVVCAALVGTLAAQDAQGTVDKTDELVGKIQADGDRVEEQVVLDLAALRTERALDALIEAYGSFQTTYMKREVVRSLRLFDGVAGCEQKAMQRLTDEATSGAEPELRDAAVAALGSCSIGGKHWLELIVKSTADDSVRERAFDAFIGLSTDADHEWYRQIWKPKQDEAEKGKPKAKKPKKPKKGEKDDAAEEEAPRAGKILESMRVSAFRVIAPKLTVDELVDSATNERSHLIRKSALEELAQRKDKKTLDVAWSVVKQDGERPENRVAAAQIVASIEGTKAAPDFAKRAVRLDAPVELRRGLAQILADFNDPEVNKLLIKELGRGKVTEKLFQMYAVRSLQDERVDKALLKMLLDKEPAVVVGAARILGERRYTGAGPALMELFQTSTDRDVRRVAIDSAALVRVGDPAWVDQLIAFTKSDDPELRNLALTQLGATSDRTHLEALVVALDDPNWSTRLAALEALEAMRTIEGVTAMVARMPKEDGRMLSEFAQALWRLTGQSFQEDAKAWQAWWAASKDSFELISAADLATVRSGEEEYRLRQTTRVKNAFFGIKIISRRVLFILDVSGSMEEKLNDDYKGRKGWSRMEVARDEMKKCLENLDSGAFFNVMVFSSGVEKWTDGALVACDDVHRAQALAYVDKLLAFGGTNLYDSLKEAFADPEIDTIFLMSDGEPSQGEVVEPLIIREHVAHWNENRRVVINTVAVGGALSILEWLAEDSGGTHVKFE